MVADPEPNAVGLCHLSGSRWSSVPSSVPSDEKRLCKRHISLCCDGVPEVEYLGLFTNSRLGSSAIYISISMSLRVAWMFSVFSSVTS